MAADHNGPANTIATLRAEVDGLKSDVGDINRKLDNLAAKWENSRGFNWQALGIALTASGMLATILVFFGEMRVRPIEKDLNRVTGEFEKRVDKEHEYVRDSLKQEHGDMLTVWASAEARITRTDERLSRELNEARKQLEENSRGIAVLDRDGIETETQFGRFADAINSRQATLMSLLNQERRESQHEAFDDPQPWVAFEKIKGSR